MVAGGKLMSVDVRNCSALVSKWLQRVSGFRPSPPAFSGQFRQLFQAGLALSHAVAPSSGEKEPARHKAGARKLQTTYATYL